MPATSIAQRRLFAVAEHNPGALHKKNKGLLGLSHQTLHEFADTKESGLPQKKGPLRRAAERYKR
jgi:hypothetical protein